MNTENLSSQPMKVSITTLGCKSNQYDSFAMGESLSSNRFDVVPFPSMADAYIINTCTVTGKTDCQSRQLVRRVRRLNPEAVVIVTGCYAEVSPDEVAAIEGVDYILGNPEKGKVLECLLSGRRNESPVRLVGEESPASPFTLKAREQKGRTRASLKVQDGCSLSCTYCIIPRARGASRSLSIDEIEREIDILTEKGFREIVLTGIHLGAWGEEGAGGAGGAGGGEGIARLIELIEKKDRGARFRLSSLDPDEVTDEVIEMLSASKNICNHVHIALQSGDDRILKLMKRGYGREVFGERVAKLHSSVPEVSIGVDVIAGFPGEGEREFENTYSLLKDLPVSYMHIFPFSRRKGAPAASFRGQVHCAKIRERCEALKSLDAMKREAFYSSSIGKTAEVLVEDKLDKKTGMRKGKSRNYIPVLIPDPGVRAGEMVYCELIGVTATGMTGVNMTIAGERGR